MANGVLGLSSPGVFPAKSAATGRQGTATEHLGEGVRAEGIQLPEVGHNSFKQALGLWVN